MTKIQSFDGEARPSDPKESADKGESGAGSDGMRDTAPERALIGDGRPPLYGPRVINLGGTAANAAP